MTSYINDAVHSLRTAPFLFVLVLSALMILYGGIVYRFIGGGVIESFSGRGKRLATAIPAYYLGAIAPASFLGLTHYAILFVTLYFILMFATRSPEIGCYYVWVKTSSGEIVLPREPTTFYNKALIKYHGFFAAQKLRLAVYPAACTLIIASLSLIYFAIPLNPNVSTGWALFLTAAATANMLVGPYLSYVTNVQRSGNYYNLDIVAAEYAMGVFIANASMFIIVAI